MEDEAKVLLVKDELGKDDVGGVGDGEGDAGHDADDAVLLDREGAGVEAPAQAEGVEAAVGQEARPGMAEGPGDDLADERADGDGGLAEGEEGVHGGTDKDEGQADDPGANRVACEILVVVSDGGADLGIGRVLLLVCLLGVLAGHLELVVGEQAVLLGARAVQELELVVGQAVHKGLVLELAVATGARPDRGEAVLEPVDGVGPSMRRGEGGGGGGGIYARGLCVGTTRVRHGVVVGRGRGPGLRKGVSGARVGLV